MADPYLDNTAMPASISAEQAVLGAILIDQSGQAAVTALEQLTGNEFFRETHQHIFAAVAELIADNTPADMITLTTRLADRQQLDKVGGVEFLSSLASSVPTAANLEYYIAIIKDKYFLRRAKQLSLQSLSDVTTMADATQVIAGMQEQAAALALQAAPKKTFRTIGDVALDVYSNVEAQYFASETNGGITGIPSGFVDLDKMTSGFQRSDLIIVAARPSVGKTAFALNIAQNVGVREKKRVAVFSLEMGADQLVQRMVSAEANIDAGRLRTGYLQADDWERMAAAISKLSQANIYIDDSPMLDVFDILVKARQLQRESGLDMIVVDYLQLLLSRKGRKNAENRQQEVSEISRTLKQIARELNVPVIALSQLSRGVEQRQDKRPMMSDLRESGSIEQDADIVAFLYRDDYYDKESEKKNIIEIIIAKQRNGPVGTVELAFLKQFNKFVNLERTG